MTVPADLDLSLFRHVRNNTALTASPHFNKIREIFHAMSDEDFVLQGIDTLEKQMWDELVRRYREEPQARPDLRKKFYAGKEKLTAGFKDRFAPAKAVTVDAGRKVANINKGLLTTVLERVERAHGFASVSYAWGTSAEHFLSNLKARRPFKDYGASASHGDNTHRVQWFIICKLLCPGIADAAKYYEETANWTTTVNFSKPIGNGVFQAGDHVVYLWDFLCDNASNTTGWDKNQAKGLNPMYVMDLLRSPDHPLLSSFITYRMTKLGHSKSRSARFQNEVAPTGVAFQTLHRAAMRFHNTSYDALSSAQRHALAATLGAAGFTDRQGGALPELEGDVNEYL